MQVFFFFIFIFIFFHEFTTRWQSQGLQLPGNIFSVQTPAASNKNHTETRTKPYRSTP